MLTPPIYPTNGPLEDDTPRCDYDAWPLNGGTDLREVSLTNQELMPPWPLFVLEVVKSPPQPVLPVRSNGKRKLQRPRNTADDTVIVNGEIRGPEWGIGRAAAEFDRLRREYETIPIGRRVEYDILTQLGLPFKR